MLDNLTIIVLAFNEERKIGKALESVRDFARSMVVDGYSTDQTCEIATAFDATVIKSDRLGPKNPGGFSEQRNFALSQATTDWVFFLDADEMFTDDLKNEVGHLMHTAIRESIDAFRVRRTEHFWGIATQYTHGEAWQTRLLRRTNCRYDGRLVHEGLVYDGDCADLQSRLLHFSKDSIHDYIQTMNRYTTLEAQHAESQKLPLPATPLPGMIKTFLNIYCYKQSYKEGAFGLSMSILFAVYNGLCWMKLWELRVKASDIQPMTIRSRLLPLSASMFSFLWRFLRPPRE